MPRHHAGSKRSRWPRYWVFGGCGVPPACRDNDSPEALGSPDQWKAVQVKTQEQVLGGWVTRTPRSATPSLGLGEGRGLPLRMATVGAPGGACSFKTGVPNPWLQTGAGPWPVRNRAAQREGSGGQAKPRHRQHPRLGSTSDPRASASLGSTGPWGSLR